MSFVSVEFTFHGSSIQGVLYSEKPFPDLALLAQDLIDYIEEDSGEQDLIDYLIDYIEEDSEK